MSNKISLNSNVSLGVVPTHLKFVGGLVPDENGRMPRDEDNKLVVVARMEGIKNRCPMPVDCVQVPYFPGLDDGDVKEMVLGLRDIGLDVHFILMVGGGDPMNPDDEDGVVEVLVNGLNAAKRNNIRHVSSTSVELWMQDVEPKTGAEFVSAVDQNVKVHTRAVNEAGLDDSSVVAWHIEFLRKGEFQTFTDLRKIWAFVQAANVAMGRPFFKALIDAAHCGDSDLSIAENQELIDRIAAEDAFGIFHASAKTTRGCLSTDDGWIAALLSACAKTGKLETVLVEVFHHADEALGELRNLEPGHGVDTTDGRTYDEVVIDGIVDMGRRLNNLVARGLL